MVADSEATWGGGVVGGGVGFGGGQGGVGWGGGLGGGMVGCWVGLGWGREPSSHDVSTGLLLKDPGFPWFGRMGECLFRVPL